jgi:hypothetical protein
MHPRDCPSWAYEQHQDRDLLLPYSAKALLRDLGSDRSAWRAVAKDTRPAHGRLFRGLTPPQCDYYAGHYRGEPFRCLQHLEVRTSDDPNVGRPAARVGALLATLSRLIEEGIAELDSWEMSEDKVHGSVALACEVFVEFLTIHPYANGNGHAARLVVIAVLASQGLQVNGWPVEPRPAEPYIDLIKKYRKGDREPLERRLIALMSPPPAVSPASTS